LWELEVIRATADPTRVLLYFPRDAFGTPEDSYSELREPIGAKLGVALPDLKSAPVLVGFDVSWNPEPIQASAWKVHKVLLYGGWSSTANAIAKALKARGMPRRFHPPIGMTMIGLLRLAGLGAIVFVVGIFIWKGIRALCHQAGG
jgi:hypothetical protein